MRNVKVRETENLCDTQAFYVLYEESFEVSENTLFRGCKISNKSSQMVILTILLFLLSN